MMMFAGYFPFSLNQPLWCGLAIKMAVVRPIVWSFFEEMEVELPVLRVWLLHPVQPYLLAASAVAVIAAGVIVRSRIAPRVPQGQSSQQEARYSANHLWLKLL